MGTMPGRLTLAGLEAFVAVADERSISAAARRIGASPSAVSQQISHLESILGAQVLDRTTRPLSVTAAGARLRARAERVLSELRQARAELAAVDPGALSELRLGMIEDFDADVTPRLLSALAARLDDCTFLLETGPSHRLAHQLEALALDVAVATETGPAAPWMEIHPLLADPFIVALPGRAVPSADELTALLQTLPLIQYTPRHFIGRMIAEYLQRQQVPVSHRFELDSYSAIMALVADGAGWTLLPLLGCLQARRAGAPVTLLPAPYGPLSRRITLTARREVLGDMPGRIADILRPILQSRVIDPARKELPWLGDQVGVLQVP